MKKDEDPQPQDECQDESQDEPIIISLEAARKDGQPTDPPDPSDSADPKVEENFWAGRNHAMRRSARWAA